MMLSRIFYGLVPSTIGFKCRLTTEGVQTRSRAKKKTVYCGTEINSVFSGGEIDIASKQHGKNYA
jgi:hypothetical protein